MQAAIDTATGTLATPKLSSNEVLSSFYILIWMCVALWWLVLYIGRLFNCLSFRIFLAEEWKLISRTSTLKRLLSLFCMYYIYAQRTCCRSHL